jgi:3-oxoacyl-[acyl-carrier-protein] synthase-3
MTDATTVHLGGARYALGELEADHTTIENLAERVAELKLPTNAKLMGWGSIRRSERALEELAVESGRATLAAAGVDAADVDALIVCSTRVPGNSDGHGSFMASVLTGTGLGDIPFYSQTLNRCTNLLAALDVAHAFVRSGRYRCILVVTADKVEAGGERVASYALFSDAAASCLVTAEPGADDGYQLVACASAQEAASLEWTKEISSDLSRKVNDALLSPIGMKIGDLGALMHLNIVKPLLALKEMQAGFSPAQLFTENIARLGHCFAADPLINLVDREALGHVQPGGWYMLAASVPGSRAGVLLHRSAAPAEEVI